jgi:hypothetical protein
MIKRINFCVNYKGQMRKLCGLVLRSENNDIYFYEPVYPQSHISFHKDGSVWLKSNFNERKGIQLFSRRESNPKIQGLIPLLYYFPKDFSNYPILKEKSNEFNITINHPENNSVVIKIFKAGLGLTPENIPKEHYNIKSYLITGIKNNGDKIEKEFPLQIFAFKHHNIHCDIMNYNFPSFFNHRIILISDAITEFDLFKALEKENPVFIKNRVLINDFKYTRNVKCLTY